MYVVIGSVCDEVSGKFYEAEIFSASMKEEVEDFIKKYKPPANVAHNKLRILVEKEEVELDV